MSAEDSPQEIPDDELTDEELSVDDLEAAYQKALETMQSAEMELGQAFADLIEEDEGEEDSPEEESLEMITSIGAAPDSDEEADANEPIPELLESETNERLTAREILEGFLFVGGEPLTAKKLAGLLGGSFTATTVQKELDELNDLYANERRPYEVRLGSGGYALYLKNAFEGVRNKVFGFGPREVKLSQDALEILSIIAYRQPIDRAEIERQKKSNAGNVLRQLLRRELIALDRTTEDVNYTTTPRFLDVFGLRNLSELPIADSLNYK